MGQQKKDIISLLDQIKDGLSDVADDAEVGGGAASLKPGILGDGVSPDLDAQQRSQVSASSVRDDDVGQAERFKVAIGDRDGHQFNNRKHAEELSISYDHDMRGVRGSHLARIQQLAEQALQNAVTVANSVATNGMVSSNRTNQNAPAWDDRQKTMADRHQDLSADAQIQDPSEGVSEATVVKAGQLDSATLAAINAAVAAAVSQALASKG